MHFEIPVDDVDRAKKFYEELFGWKITRFDMPQGGDPYYMVYAAETDEKNMVKTPGTINGGMMKRQKGAVFTNYIAVDSISEKLEEIKSRGGEVLMEKTEIGPDMGWIAMFKDTEGNVMGLHETPPGKM